MGQMMTHALTECLVIKKGAVAIKRGWPSTFAPKWLPSPLLLVGDSKFILQENL